MRRRTPAAAGPRRPDLERRVRKLRRLSFLSPSDARGLELIMDDAIAKRTAEIGANWIPKPRRVH